VEHGVTSFIVEGEAEALAAIERIPDMDRRKVRAGFERRFTARRMAEAYRHRFRGLVAAADRGTVRSDSRPRLNAAGEIAAE